MKFILIIQFSTTKFKNYGANILKTYTVQNQKSNIKHIMNKLAHASYIVM